MLTLCIPKKITDYIDTENSLTQDFILNNAIFNFNISIQPSILTTLNWKKERKKERKQLLHMSLLKIKVRSYLFIWGSAKKTKNKKTTSIPSSLLTKCSWVYYVYSDSTSCPLKSAKQLY